jgi:predicted glycoside hydrolase/deacetylase ChbG (UPF0249 family)
VNIIVNADDFGLTQGMNRGIMDCFLAGSISSTTLLVNMPATEEAAGYARDHPSLGVGLHFNLTLGRPVSDPSSVPSLVGPDGCFPGRSSCEKRLLKGSIKRSDIIREFRAQVERFEDLGLKVTHIDSHQHVHLFPQVFDIVADYCLEHCIPMRAPWPWPRMRLGLRRRGCLGVPGMYLRQKARNLLLKRNVCRWKGRVRFNGGFGCILDVAGRISSITKQRYLELLSIPQGFPFEIMVHPAWVDERLEAVQLMSRVCDKEREVLTSFSLREEAEKRGLCWCSYGESFC